MAWLEEGSRAIAIMLDAIPWPVVGALTGTLIGLRFAAKQAAEQREHQDRTRFHEQRMKMYVDFLSASLSVQATARDIHQSDDAEPSVEMLKDQATCTDQLTDSMGRIDIIGRDFVRSKGRDVFEAVLKYIKEGPGENDANWLATQTTIIDFEEVARTELGIDVID